MYIKKVTPLIKCFALTALFSTILTSTISSASEKGTWLSSAANDLNGVSTVYTTYESGGNSAETVGLYVKTTSGSNVGWKEVGCAKNQFVEHTCWGEPFLRRYGRVNIKSSCWHSPGFDS